MIAKIRTTLKDNSGVAMIYSLVIGVVVAIFAVMLLMVSYSLYVQSSKQIGQQQCRILADSFAENFAGELEDNTSDISLYLSKRISGEIEPKWVRMPADATEVSSIDMYFVPEDTNFDIMVHMSFGGADYCADDEKTLKDDNDPEDDLQDDDDIPEGTTPLPGGDDGIGAGDVVDIEATITCSKGGVNGIDVQKYTVTRTYKVKIDD